MISCFTARPINTRPRPPLRAMEKSPTRIIPADRSNLSTPFCRQVIAAKQVGSGLESCYRYHDWAETRGVSAATRHTRLVCIRRHELLSDHWAWPQGRSSVRMGWTFKLREYRAASCLISELLQNRGGTREQHTALHDTQNPSGVHRGPLLWAPILTLVALRLAHPPSELDPETIPCTEQAPSISHCSFVSHTSLPCRGRAERTSPHTQRSPKGSLSVGPSFLDN